MKKLIYLVLFFFYTGICFAAPSSTISLTKSLTDGTTAFGSDVLTNENNIVSTFNTHTHTDITLLGTITTGVWNGTTIAVDRGGTGSTTKNFVDLTTTQTVAGAKTFSDTVTISAAATVGTTLGVTGIATFSNAVSIADGLGIPGLRWKDDTNTGIDRIAADTFSFYTGGAEIVRFGGATASTGVLNGLTVGALAFTEANHFDTTTTGSGSTTMYIGNKTIDTSASDKRKKGNIKETTKGLDLLNKIKVYDFKWKKEFDSKDTKQHIGVMAQDLFALDESLAKKPDDEETGLWTTSKDDLIALLIKSVQELSVKVDDLEKRVNVLENK